MNDKSYLQVFKCLVMFKNTSWGIAQLFVIIIGLLYDKQCCSDNLRRSEMFNVHHSQKGTKPSNSVKFTKPSNSLPITTNTNESLFRDNSVIGTTGPNFLKSQKDKIEGVEPDHPPKHKRKDRSQSPENRKIPKKSKLNKEKKGKERSVGKRRRLKDYL